ncbi:43230_t:CDS:2 [Gigaspora margarita]|uniref:43230_t:CDS:1 n=1 Tax=Gigaspora margarita TaxID=4874 RepID=A0ABN7W097_GIGMA|nr:43230_t:CDS:2 [Gigaspora margarita]
MKIKNFLLSENFKEKTCIVGYCYKKGNEVGKDEKEVDKNNDAINNKLEENKNYTRKNKKNNDINKEMDKEEPCKIDIKMSKPPKEDKRDDKNSIEVKNVYDKIWEERVTALVGKKKKEIFQSQETLNKTCKAWLENVSYFQQEIKAPDYQVQTK